MEKKALDKGREVYYIINKLGKGDANLIFSSISAAGQLLLIGSFFIFISS